MKTKRLTFRIVARYTLLQLPSLIGGALFVILLRQWVDIPGHLTWGFIGIWVLKDIVLFPFLWRFYDPTQYRDWFGMVGRKGIALSQLDPKGYVQIRGDLWQAEAAKTELAIAKGQTICVKEINGLQLIVKNNANDH
jgi:membrane protein implicated in regulation of membrane protease activity